VELGGGEDQEGDEGHRDGRDQRDLASVLLQDESGNQGEEDGAQGRGARCSGKEASLFSNPRIHESIRACTYAADTGICSVPTCLSTIDF
jgi:hypothetical protein